jgi:hypothetical protein
VARSPPQVVFPLALLCCRDAAAAPGVDELVQRGVAAFLESHCTAANVAAYSWSQWQQARSSHEEVGTASDPSPLCSDTAAHSQHPLSGMHLMSHAHDSTFGGAVGNQCRRPTADSLWFTLMIIVWRAQAVSRTKAEIRDAVLQNHGEAAAAAAGGKVTEMLRGAWGRRARKVC